MIIILNINNTLRLFCILFNNDYQYKGLAMINCIKIKNKNDLVKPTGCTC